MTHPFCIAIIPARGGSKGVPRKNVRIVGGKPLVGRTINAARQAKLIDAVIVSTDDDEIASTATTYGAKVVRRPAEISGDTASSESALIHTLDMLAKENLVPEITVLLQCTSPFTTGVDIDVVVQALIDENTQAALAVTEDHGFLWRLNQDGTASGINHDHLKPRKRRQDLETQYLETGAVYAMRTQAFLEKGTRFCGPTVAVPIASPPIDIDTEADLRLADIYYNVEMSNCAPTVVPNGIRLLATDFDGVHTGDTVYVDENGVESVRCSRSDGLGLERLRKAGIPLLILSKETNIVVSRRAAKLKAEVLQQIDDKWPTLQAWLITQGLKPEQIAYVGNDINDLECLSHVGWACSPADANSAVKAVVHYISPKPGGQGALRDIAEKLLSSLLTRQLLMPKTSEVCCDASHENYRNKKAEAGSTGVIAKTSCTTSQSRQELQRD